MNNEDPVQQTITESCAGNRAKVRLAKLLLSFLLSVFLGLVAMVPPIFLSSEGVRSKDLVAGACAQAIAALAAVGLGGLVQSTHRPTSRLVRSLGDSWLVSATILIPNGVPSRQLLVLFNRTGQVALAVPILLIGLETLALCVLAIVLSIRLATSRS